MNISFELDGKKVDPKNMRDALEASILSSVEESLKKDLAGVRCPEHDQLPTVKVKGRNLDNLSYVVTGCCDALIEKVNQKLQ